MEKCETVYEDQCEVSYRAGRQCQKVAKLECRTEEVRELRSASINFDFYRLTD